MFRSRLVQGYRISTLYLNSNRYRLKCFRKRILGQNCKRVGSLTSAAISSPRRISSIIFASVDREYVISIRRIAIGCGLMEMHPFLHKAFSDHCVMLDCYVISSQRFPFQVPPDIPIKPCVVLCGACAEHNGDYNTTSHRHAYGIADAGSSRN